MEQLKTLEADTRKNGADVLDKRGYADRWHFSIRTIDNFLAQGMPHFKIGKRRVRIYVLEADAWMRAQFATQRRK